MWNRILGRSAYSCCMAFAWRWAPGCQTSPSSPHHILPFLPDFSGRHECMVIDEGWTKVYVRKFEAESYYLVILPKWVVHDEGCYTVNLPPKSLTPMSPQLNPRLPSPFLIFTWTLVTFRCNTYPPTMHQIMRHSERRESVGEIRFFLNKVLFQLFLLSRCLLL
jgi:hypothetical protein